MKILIVTQYFHPENLRLNDFALGFIKKGHDVSVISSIPNYPHGKFYKGYGFFTKIQEIYKGIKIYRSPAIPRGSGSNLRLAINYISYVFGAILRSLLILNNKIDVIFVFGSPMTVGLPAIFIKKLKGVPICFWVVDLWPESVVSGGNLKSNLIPKILTPMVKFIYNQSDRILVSSKGFIASIEEKGIVRNKIQFFPQWAEPIFKPVKSTQYLLGDVPKDSFKIMFAGNIGEAQDFPSILDAAKELMHYDDIQWIILGDGSKKEWVKLKIKEYKLESNFHLLGSFHIDKMPEFYSNADVMLFSLKDEYIFSITIPAKVQSYLACGKPILSMINGEAGKIVDNANAGLTCPAGSSISLAKNVLKIKEMPAYKMREMGRNARKYYVDNFERASLFDKAEEIFYSMIDDKSD
jgi:glycosyltransferase involved in cell wall biosynthesis